MPHSSKSLIKKILASRTFLFLVSLALIALVISVGRETYRKHQLAKEIEKIETEIKQLEGRNQYLSNLREYFQEDSFLEKEAKIKMNLKNPGENVVVIEHTKTEEETIEEKLEVLSNEEKAANYWDWWKYFFGD